MSLFVKIKGKIKYYSLEKWWKSLNKDERAIILTTYKAGNSKDLINNKISDMEESEIIFLSNLAKWFEKPETYHIALKIINQCEELINNATFSNEDLCYFYNTAIQILYRNRNNHTDALSLAKNYCLKQVSLILKNKNIKFTSPISFQRLVSIYENQKEYYKALDICDKAINNNISGDWEKKMMKLSSRL